MSRRVNQHAPAASGNTPRLATLLAYEVEQAGHKLHKRENGDGGDYGPDKAASAYSAHDSAHDDPVSGEPGALIEVKASYIRPKEELLPPPSRCAAAAAANVNAASPPKKWLYRAKWQRDGERPGSSSPAKPKATAGLKADPQQSLQPIVAEVSIVLDLGLEGEYAEQQMELPLLPLLPKNAGGASRSPLTSSPVKERNLHCTRPAHRSAVPLPPRPRKMIAVVPEDVNLGAKAGVHADRRKNAEAPAPFVPPEAAAGKQQHEDSLLLQPAEDRDEEQQQEQRRRSRTAPASSASALSLKSRHRALRAKHRKLRDACEYYRKRLMRWEAGDDAVLEEEANLLGELKAESEIDARRLLEQADARREVDQEDPAAAGGGDALRTRTVSSSSGGGLGSLAGAPLGSGTPTAGARKKSGRHRNIASFVAKNFSIIDEGVELDEEAPTVVHLIRSTIANLSRMATEQSAGVVPVDSRATSVPEEDGKSSAGKARSTMYGMNLSGMHSMFSSTLSETVQTAMNEAEAVGERIAAARIDSSSVGNAKSTSSPEIRGPLSKLASGATSPLKKTSPSDRENDCSAPPSPVLDDRVLGKVAHKLQARHTRFNTTVAVDSPNPASNGNNTSSERARVIKRARFSTWRRRSARLSSVLTSKEKIRDQARRNTTRRRTRRVASYDRSTMIRSSKIDEAVNGIARWFGNVGFAVGIAGAGAAGAAAGGIAAPAAGALLGAGDASPGSEVRIQVPNNQRNLQPAVETAKNGPEFLGFLLQTIQGLFGAGQQCSCTLFFLGDVTALGAPELLALNRIPLQQLTLQEYGRLCAEANVVADDVDRQRHNQEGEASAAAGVPTGASPLAGGRMTTAGRSNKTLVLPPDAAGIHSGKFTVTSSSNSPMRRSGPLLQRATVNDSPLRGRTTAVASPVRKSGIGAGSTADSIAPSRKSRSPAKMGGAGAVTFCGVDEDATSSLSLLVEEFFVDEQKVLAVGLSDQFGNAARTPGAANLYRPSSFLSLPLWHRGGVLFELQRNLRLDQACRVFVRLATSSATAAGNAEPAEILLVGPTSSVVEPSTSSLPTDHVSSSAVPAQPQPQEPDAEAPGVVKNVSSIAGATTEPTPFDETGLSVAKKKAAFRIAEAHLAPVRFVSKIAFDFFYLVRRHVASAQVSTRALALTANLRAYYDQQTSSSKEAVAHHQDHFHRAGGDAGKTGDRERDQGCHDLTNSSSEIKHKLAALELKMKHLLEELFLGVHSTRFLLVLENELVLAPFSGIQFEFAGEVPAGGLLPPLGGRKGSNEEATTVGAAKNSLGDHSGCSPRRKVKKTGSPMRAGAQRNVKSPAGVTAAPGATRAVGFVGTSDKRKWNESAVVPHRPGGAKNAAISPGPRTRRRINFETRTAGDNDAVATGVGDEQDSSEDEEDRSAESERHRRTRVTIAGKKAVRTHIRFSVWRGLAGCTVRSGEVSYFHAGGSSRKVAGHGRSARLTFDPEVDGVLLGQPAMRTVSDVHILSGPVFLSNQFLASLFSSSSSSSSNRDAAQHAAGSEHQTLGEHQQSMSSPSLVHYLLQSLLKYNKVAVTAGGVVHHFGEGTTAAAAGAALLGGSGPLLPEIASSPDHTATPTAGAANTRNAAVPANGSPTKSTVFMVVQVVAYRRAFTRQEVDLFSHALQNYGLLLETLLLEAVMQYIPSAAAGR